jgi:hypothetical protein
MNITSANAVLFLTVPPIFPQPVQIQGFAADDVYDLDEIESIETQMGVDGILSGGWTWKPQPQRVMLQADSPSNDFFDQWYAAMQAAQTVFLAQGIITLPAISKKMIQVNGFLSGYKLPGAKRVLQPRSFRLTWNKVLPAPA